MYLGEDLCKFMIISCWLLLRMWSVSDRVVEKIKITLLVGKIFFQKSCHLGNNVEKYVRATGGSDKMWRACQITKAGMQMHTCIV